MGFTILKILIVVLIICVILLMKKFRNQKTHFDNKACKLMRKIHAIKEQQLDLNNKVMLSDSFNESYQKSRNTIAQSIYEANVELLKNNS